MADFVFNVAKGRVAEFYNRVDTNDPTNSALIIVLIKTSGIESDATLKDYALLSTLLAAANDEATNSGYARKTLTDADLTALTIDNTNDRVDLDFPDQVWSAVAAVGGAISKLLVCYDGDTTGGTDANIIPLTAHDFVVTPDGTDLTAQVSVSGFYRAS